MNNFGTADNPYNLPEDEGPFANPLGQKGSFDFDNDYEDGVISSAKIREAQIGTAQIGTISFSNISGGTATLGGTLDGNGLMTILDAGGTEVVRLDNNGITISQGSITNVTVTNTTTESGTINNADIGTSLFQGGTIANALIGTSQVTGGTVNPSVYQFGGTAGIGTTFTFLTSATVPGTIVVEGGIITSVTS